MYKRQIQPTGGSIQVEGDTLQSLRGKALAEYRGKKDGYLFQNFELLECYDLAPITSFTLGRSLRLRTSGTPGFHGLTGGVYKARCV